MIELGTIEEVRNYLLRQKLIADNTAVGITQLDGGVSSNVWKITWRERKWVLKQALHKLKVKATWFSDVKRIHREHEVMQALYPEMPKNSIPDVVFRDYINHVYIMASADETARTWKDILMHGNFDTANAVKAGLTLKNLHESGGKIGLADKKKFSDQKYFIQLRIEPFHLYLLQQYPHLNRDIHQLIHEVTHKKVCLVHADFSPKNMLIEQDGNLVLIDFEVAHWGNPVFDVAYCIGHLMLKGWHLKKEKEAIKLIYAFFDTYSATVENLLPHLGLMLLARMDGKSPVNYITNDNLKDKIRSIAISWIKGEVKEKDPLQNIQAAYL